jgi:hypothetical protein
MRVQMNARILSIQVLILNASIECKARRVLVKGSAQSGFEARKVRRSRITGSEQSP